jgi:polypeptide N-acetylgalactosaminyltransferase
MIYPYVQVDVGGMRMAVVTRYNSFLLGILFASITWAVSLYLYSVITQESSTKLATTSKSPFTNISPANSENNINSYQQNEHIVNSDAFFIQTPTPKKSDHKAYHVTGNDIDIPLEPKAVGKSFNLLKNAHYWGSYKNSDALIHKLQPRTLKPGINEVGMVKTAEDQALKTEGYKVHAFNVLVSRELSYSREVPDTRHHL